jgi:anti-sigma factor RsiW
MEDRIEAYLDGDLAADEAAAFAYHLGDDEAWGEELFLAAEIQGVLREMPIPPCPSHVAPAVLAEARRRHRSGLRKQFQARLAGLWADTWRPAFAMAVLVVLVVSASLIGNTTRQPDAAASEEVQLALADVKLTLAYLSEVGRRTGTSVRQDVLESHVVLPVQHALGSVRDEHAR